MKRLLLLLSALGMFSIMAFSQKRTVTGKVIDETGAAVPAVSIRVKGTKEGMAADINGRFRLSLKTGDVLVITGGVEEKEVTVGAESDMTITVKRAATTEKEVIVTTALGIRKRPREVGVANTTLRSDQITNGQSPRLGQALSGKVAGLTVFNTSNAVDAAPRIVLRGNRSITGDNTALIVVDGVPVPASTLNYLNPNDVESVTILKGGQAATLYGPEGVNGALVITTKKGGGKPQIQFSSTTNFEDVAYLPKDQKEFGSGSGYGLTLEENFRPFENQQYGDRFDGSIRSAGRKLEDGSFQSYPYEYIPGIRRKVWNTGVSVTNDISISGGDANSKFYLSFQDAYIKGIVPKDVYHRDALRFNGSKTYGKFKASFDGTFAFDKSDRTSSNFYFFALNTPAWVPIDKLKDWQTNPFANPNGYFNDYYNNPWYMLDNNRLVGRNNYFNGNVALNFKPVSWIEFNYRLGTAINNYSSKGWTDRFDYSEYAKGNLAVKPVTANPQYNDYSYVWRARNTPIPGAVADGSGFDWRINSDFFVTLDKTWGDISSKLILGNSIQDRKAKDMNAATTSVIIPGLFNIGNRSGEIVGNETTAQQRRVGHFADLTLGFKDKVFLHGSVRHDASSLFFSPMRDRKLYNFTYYGGDVSVVVTDLIPALRSNLLNYLKLRASYNKNGNENLGPYSLDPTFTPGAGFPYGSNVGVTVDNTYPDPSLQPEFAYSREAGFEASLWKNRINVDFSYFNQDVKNQVFNVAISSSTGYFNTLLNAGRVVNRGIESEMKVKLLQGKTWNIDISGNYTWNTNSVKSLFGGLSQLQLNAGGNTGTANTAFIFAEIGQPFPLLRTTYYAIDSVSGSTIINAADGWPVLGNGLKNEGTTIPKHQLGLGLKVAYKWVTLTANAEYRGGNVVYHGLGQTMSFTGASAATTRYHRQQFIWPNSVYWDGSKYVPNKDIAVRNDMAIYLGWGDYSTSRSILGVGDWFTTSGAFWKIRDISLDFAIPQKWYSRVKALKGVDLSFFGRNLFTWLPEENIYTDPEFANTNNNGVGINNTLNTPPVKQYGATLKLVF